MPIAILGPPASGKSTLFRALTSRTGQSEESHSHNEPVPGILRNWEPRLERLASVIKPKRVVHPTFEIFDIPGSPWETGKGREPVIRGIRQSETFLIVIPAFDPTRDPGKELGDMKTEMIISDLAQVEKRLKRMKKEHAEGLECDIIETVNEHLSQDRPLRSLSLTEREEEAIRGYGFLSQKPAIVAINRAEDNSLDLSDLRSQATDFGMRVFDVCATLEEELAELAESEQEEMRAALGLDRPAKDQFVSEVYHLWHYITFLTANPNECRAWPVPEGITAVHAAGKIHSDMEKGFIKAEVVKYQDFEELGGMAQCRQAGKLRLEGKDHAVHDGDIITFRFNV